MGDDAVCMALKVTGAGLLLVPCESSNEVTPPIAMFPLRFLVPMAFAGGGGGSVFLSPKKSVIPLDSGPCASSHTQISFIHLTSFRKYLI